MTTDVFLGVDIGTSGIRGSVIDAHEKEIISHHIAFDKQAIQHGKNEQDPYLWLQQFDSLLSEMSQQLQRLGPSQQIAAIAIDGTSSTLIACKKDGSALSPALMYNDQQSQKQAEIIAQFVPAETAVHGASSSLAKALLLLERYPETEIFCHQADWLASNLTGKIGVSDENNCLKLGYDSVNQCWPDWLHENHKNAIISKAQLPKVYPPGTVMAAVTPAQIEKYKFAKNCKLIAGTTDSNAAVLATGAHQLGDAVTSLGSTLVIKIFSDKPIFNAKYGIYSHRLNNSWLIGGASNSGGSVLLQYFTTNELDAMTPQLQPEQSIGLNYYPLPCTGERFPINDCYKKNVTEPRPTSNVQFFQALLEGIANIESEGYKKLKALGGVTPKRIFTAGGGSKNLPWQTIRKRTTGINIINAQHSEASYGSALLAKSGYLNS